MKLRPALDRLGRGFRRMGAWIKRRVLSARGYRYDGEQAAHAEALQETQVALSLMANANSDPEQVRMASDIEHGMENRLGVLLGKARLTLEEKRERDAIQNALQARRQGFDAPAEQTRPRGFLALGGASVAMTILASPLTWIAAGVAAFGLQTARLHNAKHDLTEARAANRSLTQTLSDRTAERDLLKEAVVAADQLSHQTAANLEAERARASRAAAIERRRQREIQNVLTGRDPPAWSLRNAGELPAPTGDDSPASGDPSGMPR